MNEKDRQLILSQISNEERALELKERKRLDEKRYLSEIIKEEKPVFESNNLILSPVGSGKSHLIESMLIPENYNKTVLYLTSNTALKDSICPEDSIIRKALADKGVSKGFYTSENKNRFGEVPYKVHVMTYSEFGQRVVNPNSKLLKNVELIFCDEIHSLPKYFEYENGYRLAIALNTLFRKHEGVTIFFFTATKESIYELERRNPGFLDNTKVFDYLDRKDIVKYVAKTTHYISHISQIRAHLRAKKESFDYYNFKALAFTKFIKDQDIIKQIAIEEGFKPISLWSINNDDNEMTEEQLYVRNYILNTGLIPREYNLLIINGSMQEGWNLHDDKVELAILNTTDITEQIQSLGRIRKDIDLVIKKTNDLKLVKDIIKVPDAYMNKKLTKEDKDSLCEELNLLNDRGNLKKWTSIKRHIENSGYKIEETHDYIDDKQIRVSIIRLK